MPYEHSASVDKRRSLVTEKSELQGPEDYVSHTAGSLTLVNAKPPKPKG